MPRFSHIFEIPGWLYEATEPGTSLDYNTYQLSNINRLMNEAIEDLVINDDAEGLRAFKQEHSEWLAFRCYKQGHIRKISDYYYNINLYLEKNGKGETPLHVAARYGSCCILDEMFVNQMCPDVDEEDNSGLSAIEVGIRDEQTLFVCKLFSVIKNCEFRLGQLSFGIQQKLIPLSATHNNLELVRFFGENIEHGLSEIDDAGNAPLDLALESISIEREKRRKFEQLLENVKAGRITSINLAEFEIEMDFFHGKVLKGHSETVFALTVFSDGRLASGSKDKTIKIWDPQTGECLNTLTRSSGWVTTLTITPDGKLASESNEGTIKIWDPQTGECIHTLKGHSDGNAHDLAFLPDGRLVSSGTSGFSEGTIKIWDLQTGECIRTLRHSRDCTLTIFPDGRLVSGSFNKTIKIWNSQTGKCIHTLKGHSDCVNILAILPDGQLASGSFDETIKIWDPQTGKCIHTLKGHSGWVRALAVLQDGRLASGADDETIKIWDPQTGKHLKTLSGHSESVQTLTVFPDGRLVSGSEDKTIKIWSLQTGECLNTLTEHSCWIRALVFPDGRLAGVGSPDNTIKLYICPLYQLFEVLKKNTSVTEITGIGAESGSQHLRDRIDKLVARNILLSKLEKLSVGSQKEREELIEWLAQEKEAPFFTAIEAGSLEAIDQLIKLVGENINQQQEESGATPLHLAVVFRHTWIVYLLLADPRLDLNSQDNHGSTPLHIAAMNSDYFKVVEQLLLFGARIDLKTADGKTALKLAQETEDNPVTTLLKQAEKCKPYLLMDYPGFSGEKTISVFLEMHAYFVAKNTQNKTSYETKLADFGQLLLLLRDSTQDEALNQYIQEHGFKHKNLFQRNRYHNLRVQIISLPQSDRQEAFDKYITYLQHLYAHLQTFQPHPSRKNLLTELEISIQILGRLEVIPEQESAVSEPEHRTALTR
jgi:WD40 repeat protein